MYQKGLVSRDDSQRAHIYSPNVGRDDTQGRFIKNLIDQVFEGSRAQMVQQAYQDGETPSIEEIAQLRALVDRLGAQQR